MAITNPWTCTLDELKQAAFTQRQEPAAHDDLHQLNKAFSEFSSAHPDFQNTENNANVLASYIINPFIATASDFEKAHVLAVHRKQYEAAQPIQEDNDPATMPLEKLRATWGAEVMPSQPELSLGEQAALSLNNGIQREHAEAQQLKEGIIHVSGGNR